MFDALLGLNGGTVPDLPDTYRRVRKPISHRHPNPRHRLDTITSETRFHSVDNARLSFRSGRFCHRNCFERAGHDIAGLLAPDDSDRPLGWHGQGRSRCLPVQTVTATGPISPAASLTPSLGRGKGDALLAQLTLLLFGHFTASSSAAF